MKNKTAKTRLKCIICKDSFTGFYSTQKTCSRSCRKKHAQGRRKKTYDTYKSNHVKNVDKIKQTYHGYKFGAKRRNIDFKISYNDFKKLWRKNCFYCGKEIFTIGIDRVNNNIGYENGNIIPCCSTCNSIKGTLSLVSLREKLLKRKIKLKKKLLHYNKIISFLRW